MEAASIHSRTLVVYESSFGNTKSIAEAIAFGLAGDVELIEVESAPTTLDAGLLVVGGPTHAFGLSRRGTRESAANMGAGPAPRIGLREWLGELSATPATAFATFDTKIRKPRVPGSAAASAARRLRRLGLQQVISPESFYVVGTPGPLQEGERDRAHAWGARLRQLAAPIRAATRND